MFKIGDFSKLSRVSVKTLRYYDEIGLLRPTHVDQFTGYRYYTAEQLPRLNRILALKDLGFSLEQTVRLLDSALSPAQMREILRMKRAELQRRVENEQARLERVEARLRSIEQEQTMSAYDVVIKRVDPQLVASVRSTVPTFPAVGRLFDEVWAYLDAQSAQYPGPSFAIWHDVEYRETDIDAEAAVPIDRSIPAHGRVKVYELPGVVTMACVVHHGSFDTLSLAYNALLSWIQDNGYRIAGPAREYYLQASEPIAQDDPSYLTEIQFPVEREDRLDLASAALAAEQLARLTERSRQSLKFAAEEARAAGQPSIGGSHLLVGMLRESRGFAAHVLTNLGINLDGTRQALGEEWGASASPAGDLRLGDSVRQALAVAAEEAHKRSHDYIGTEHLLLGLLGAGDLAARAVLDRAGVTPEQVCERVEEMLRNQ